MKTWTFKKLTQTAGLPFRQEYCNTGTKNFLRNNQELILKMNLPVLTVS